MTRTKLEATLSYWERLSVFSTTHSELLQYLSKMLYDNCILQNILYLGKQVHMQDSIPSGIHEGFYNLPFYRLLSNGSIPKLPAHIEDMETIAIQFNILFLSAGRGQIFLCKSHVF